MQLMGITEVMTVITPIILTIVTTYIVIKQYQLDRKRYNLEHFDYKYKIYKSVMRYLGRLVGNADTTVAEMMEFRQQVIESSFFFGDDVIEKIDEIYSKANRLRFCVKKREENKLPQREHSSIVEEEHNILSWLGDQFTECKELFQKYLKIEPIQKGN